ncbi:MAG: hypothetical protein LAQ30_32710, partial [Acidobacteriia bacterium]|nr:hypothetical protein [Terriglobia bacterium]
MAVDRAGEVVLRWDGAGDCAPLLEPGGIDAVIPGDAVRLCAREEFGRAGSVGIVAVNPGAWPGAQAAGRAV